MKITYRITADEYADAQRAHCSSKPSWRWRTRISIAVAVLLLAGSVAVTIFDPEMGVMMRPVVIILSIWFCLFLLRYGNFLWRWQYKKNDSLKRECTAEINDEGVTSSTEAAHSEMKWISFIRWYEGKNVFLLYQQPRIFNIVPKRAFGPGELEQFRDLLQRKIPARQ